MTTAISTIRVDIGEVRLARAGEQLSVFLGSCVSIILWHAQSRTAAMSHILLPFSPLTSTDDKQALFAAGAWQSMQSHLATAGIAVADCRCHVIGAAQFVDGMESGMGHIILHKVRALLNADGIAVDDTHVGGSGYRLCSFDAASGCLHVRQAAGPACGAIVFATSSHAACGQAVRTSDPHHSDVPAGVAAPFSSRPPAA